MEDGQSTGFFKMHQLGAGRDYNTWRRYFMANAELKDFADVLLCLIIEYGPTEITTHLLSGLRCPSKTSPKIKH
jgi:hypothetical protein